jgi:hypothetical protein
MVVIHLFLMICDIQRVVRDLCPTLYIDCNFELISVNPKVHVEPVSAQKSLMN